MDTFHLAYCCDNKFSRFLSPSIYNICKIHKDIKINFHILTDYISKKNKKTLLNNITNCKNISIKFYKVDDSKIKDLPSGIYTKYTWYRLLLPEIINEDINTILYLDIDTLVLNRLDRLFQLDLKNYSIAATIEDKFYMEGPYKRLSIQNDLDYICAGVLLINLNYWRDNKISEKIINWTLLNKNILKYPDQDAINVICKGSKLMLPMKYNVVNQFFIRDIFYTKRYIEHTKKAFFNPIIIHFAGCAPWLADEENHVFQEEWDTINYELRIPCKKIYKTKGCLGFKIRIWNFFHPGFIRRKIDKIDIRNKFNLL